LYRAIGDTDISVLGYASSTDGLRIDERLEKPAYVPREPFEGAGTTFSRTEENSHPFLIPLRGYEEQEARYISGGGGWGGCEDPRMTRIEDRIYMTYVAYDGSGPPRVALTSIHIDDFLARNWRWKRPVLISEPGVVNKNACIFPEKVGSSYVILHRVFPDILIDFVDDLDFDGETRWLQSRAHIKPRKDSFWDSRKVGAGPPPIKTAAGWLLIYQAIGERDSNRYKIGAMLLDLKDPAKVIARSDKPLLEPEARYENEGWKSGVVYPCGAAVIKDRLYVYYGGADMFTCVASIKLEELLDKLGGQQKNRVKIKRKKTNG
jgi:predicted GH43/DUF377 family glycosyl hydrolase